MQTGLRFDLSCLARACVALLWVMVLAEVIYAADSYAFGSFLDAVEAGTLSDAEVEAEATRIDAQAQAVGLGYLAAFVVTALVSGTWIYRASWNASQIQPSKDRITPGWAIGWFFIPILAFWKPYRAMVQTGNSSADPQGDIDESPPGYVTLWWGLWVVTNIVGNLSFRLSNRAETIEDFRLIKTIDLVTAPAAIVTALLFMRLIKTITAAQLDKHPALLGSGHSPSEEGKLS